jgi:type IV pilus assembly protein PilM
MSVAVSKRLRAAFAPPRYIAAPFSGIDVSTSGVKAVQLTPSVHGLILSRYAEVHLSSGAFVDGDIVDKPAVQKAIAEAAHHAGITATHAALPESKSYLFETAVEGGKYSEWRIAVEQHLEELIPLPPTEAFFDFVPLGPSAEGGMRIAGIGFARRLVEETIASFDEARVEVRSLEGEQFAMARALLPAGDTSTTLIIDIGKTTTKLTIVESQIPLFAATIGIGGHALTLAVQKHFGVTESEARKVKAERGIVPLPGNDEYLATMLSTVSAIRDEIARRLEYWQERVASQGIHQSVSQVIIAGGNASLRGLPEYLEGSLKIPVVPGDVFTNLASRREWVPDLDYRESLAFATAIGLALRDATMSSYA